MSISLVVVFAATVTPMVEGVIMTGVVAGTGVVTETMLGSPHSVLQKSSVQHCGGQRESW